MALPKLNSTPQYSCVIPSTKETIKYRPYLVKEEKILMIAFETGDQKAALNAIINTLQACIEGEVGVADLTTFDVEYLFTQVRSRSVGENAKILVPCGSCGHKNEIDIELSNKLLQHNGYEDEIKIDKISDESTCIQNLIFMLLYQLYNHVLTLLHK